MRETCIYCGNRLEDGAICSLCGHQPNVTCPACGEEYYATGQGICPICGYVWEEPITPL